MRRPWLTMIRVLLLVSMSGLLLAATTTAQEEHLGEQRPVVDPSLGAEVAIRAVGFMAASVAAGIAFFSLALPRSEPFQRRQRALYGWGAWAGAVAAGGSALLLLLISRFEDLTIAAATTTADGFVAAMRTLAFLVFTPLAVWASRSAPRSEPTRWILAIIGLLGIIAVTLTGHAAAAPLHRTAAITANLLHLVAVSFWLGGLVLLGVLIIGDAGSETLYIAIRRFSPLAIVAVGVIVLSGSTSSVLRLTALSDLVQTLYGRALLLKILLIVPLIGFGAINGFILQPRLRRSEPEKAVRHLRISILTETALMVIVFVAASTLAAVDPPSTVPEGVDIELP